MGELRLRLATSQLHRSYSDDFAREDRLEEKGVPLTRRHARPTLPTPLSTLSSSLCQLHSTRTSSYAYSDCFWDPTEYLPIVSYPCEALVKLLRLFPSSSSRTRNMAEVDMCARSSV